MFLAFTLLALASCAWPLEPPAASTCEVRTDLQPLADESPFAAHYNRILAQEVVEIDRAFRRYGRGEAQVYRGAVQVVTRAQGRTPRVEAFSDAIITQWSPDDEDASILAFVDLRSSFSFGRSVRKDDTGLALTRRGSFTADLPCTAAPTHEIPWRVDDEALTVGLRCTDPDTDESDVITYEADALPLPTAALDVDILEAARDAMRDFPFASRLTIRAEGPYEVIEEGEMSDWVSSSPYRGCMFRASARIEWTIQPDCLENSAVTELVLEDPRICCCDHGGYGECLPSDFEYNCYALEHP